MTEVKVEKRHRQAALCAHWSGTIGSTACGETYTWEQTGHDGGVEFYQRLNRYARALAEAEAGLPRVTQVTSAHRHTAAVNMFHLQHADWELSPGLDSWVNSGEHNDEPTDYNRLDAEAKRIAEAATKAPEVAEACSILRNSMLALRSHPSEADRVASSWARDVFGEILRLLGGSESS